MKLKRNNISFNQLFNECSDEAKRQPAALQVWDAGWPVTACVAGFIASLNTWGETFSD